MLALIRRVLARVVIIAVAAIGIAAVPQMQPLAASALSGSDFDPGYIISDERFFDAGAMSQDQVQAFLTQMTPSCPRARGLPCLRDYVGLTNTRPAQPGLCSGYNSEGYESAARIIWRVGQACGINPQVLLATLQKEQGLITQASPSEAQYRIAMGYGCPDTAACDSTFYGFFNQLYSAAKQFRQYTRTSASWRYRPGNVNIQFHPNAGCGYSTVYIRNQATANLYNYTPYQPDRAALDNLGGAGDNCSAYGNRNFWVYFNNWFGSSTANGVPYINASYAAYGGSSGILGPPTSPIVPVYQNGSGTAQAYANGSIYWTPYTGAHAVIGSYREHYFTLQGAGGPMGWPTSEQVGITGRVGGRGQAFQSGSIFSSDATGVHSVLGAIRGVYFGNGGAVGVLGWPTEQEATSAESGGGWLQQFEHGRVYSSPTWGTHPVVSAVIGVFDSSGALGGLLGWPASDPATLAQNGGGTGQAFQGGSVYSSPTGTFTVSGEMLNQYFAYGGAAGVLGWPTSAMSGAADGSYAQSFQGGTIYWTPASGGRVGDPRIEALYRSTGGSSGALGPRLSDLLRGAENGGGVAQAFAGGSVYAGASRPAFVVSGAIRSRYWSAGGSAGTLGWPIGAQSCAGDGSCSQAFQGGTVYSSSAGTRVGSPQIEAVYAASGGPNGFLGARQSELIVIPQNGGGSGQVFAGGSIYSSSAGAFAVSGGIRQEYFRVGGAAGMLAWPTAAQICTTGGTCTQQFQSGRITWSAAGGARID